MTIANPDLIRPERFAELLAYNRGWLDGTAGEPITPTSVSAAQAILQRITTAEQPGIYATEDGGVGLEWTIEQDGWFVSAEIDPAGTAELSRIRVNAGDDRAEELTTTDPDRAAAWLLAHLRPARGEQS